MKTLSEVFKDLSLSECEVLSSEVYTSDVAPPAYAAHITIKGREYVLTLVPTDLGKPEKSEG